jgi:hypothetical protein
MHLAESKRINDQVLMQTDFIFVLHWLKVMFWSQTQDCILWSQKAENQFYFVHETTEQVKHDVNTPVAEPDPDHFFLHGKALG